MKRNRAVIEDDVCVLELYDKKGAVRAHTIIDTDDFEVVRHFKWSLTGDSSKYVGARMKKGTQTKTYLHRFLMNTNSIHIDHINKDTLDNRRANLRESTHAQNFHNQSKRKTYAKRPTSSQYKGVSLHKDGSWVSEICVDKQKIYLGKFKNERDAGIAYNNSALKYFGEFARINKIEG